MRGNKTYSYSLLLLTFMLLSSLLVSVLLLTDSMCPPVYGMLWILPAVFTVYVLILIGFKVNLFSSLCTTIIISVYYIRHVITPFFMFKGEYSAVLNTSLFSKNVNFAILLIVFEGLVVCFLVSILSRKKCNIHFAEEYSDDAKELLSQNNKPRKTLWLIIIFMTLFILAVIYSDTSVLRSSFLFLLDTDTTYYALSYTGSGIGTLSMYVEIMCSFFKVVQVLLPPVLLYYLAKSHIPKNIQYFIAFGMFLLLCLFSTEERIDAIFAGIAFLFSMKAVFGKPFEKRFVQGIIFIIVVAILGLSVKSGVFSGSGGVDFKKISVMLNAYFSGIPTVSYGLEFNDSLGFFNIWRIIPDIIVKIPYAAYAFSLIFGVALPNSNSLFNQYIATAVGKGIGQILPTVVLSCIYFSALFAPLLSCVMVALAYRIGRSSYIQKDIVKKNLYNWLTICVAISPVLASAQLIVAKLAWFVIILFILKISNNIKNKFAKT